MPAFRIEGPVPDGDVPPVNGESDACVDFLGFNSVRRCHRNPGHGARMGGRVQPSATMNSAEMDLFVLPRTGWERDGFLSRRVCRCP